MTHAWIYAEINPRSFLYSDCRSTADQWKRIGDLIETANRPTAGCQLAVFCDKLALRLISHVILKSIVATIYAQLFGTILLCSDCVMAGGNRVIGGSYVPTYIQNVQVFYQPPT